MTTIIKANKQPNIKQNDDDTKTIILPHGNGKCVDPLGTKHL